MTEPSGEFAHNGLHRDLAIQGLAADDGDVTEDDFLGGRLRLRQPRSGHRTGHDAVLLAAATPARPGQRIVDFGAGVGAAGLMVARRVSGLKLVLVEIDPRLAHLAAINAQSNAIDAEMIVLDLAADAETFSAAGLPADSADVILMNPPFNDAARHRGSPQKSRELAHVATSATLERWTHAARRTLKSGGVLSLIWRADGLAEVLAALGRGFGSFVVLPVHSDPSAPAIRVLINATKGGKAPMRIMAALMLNHASVSSQQRQSETDTIRDILAGRAILPMARP